METANESTKTEKKYSVVYVAAPWEDKAWPLEKVRDLSVEKWVAPEAFMLMWVPVLKIPDGLLILRTWGFDYAGLLAWRKPKDSLEGYWLRSECEFILAATRGTPKTSYLLRHTFYEGSYSEGNCKPQAFRKLLMDAGYVAWEKRASGLDLFGAYWQGIYPKYGKDGWDFLEK